MPDALPEATLPFMQGLGLALGIHESISPPGIKPGLMCVFPPTPQSHIFLIVSVNRFKNSGTYLLFDVERHLKGNHSLNGSLLKCMWD